jgi:hypothetical protein
MQHLLFVVLGEEPALVAPDHAGQQPAARAHVDDGPVRDTGDRAGISASEAEGVDVEALEAHLDVPVLDRREHLLRDGDVFLHDEVRAVGVRLDDLLPALRRRLHAERDAVAAVVRGRLEHQALAVVRDERQQVDAPVAVVGAPGAQDPRPRDRVPDDLELVPLEQVREAGIAEQREQLLVVRHAGAERVDDADAPVARGGHEIGLVEVLKQRPAVDELDRLVLDGQRRAVVAELVERRARRLQAGRARRRADDPELGHGGRAIHVHEREPRALREVVVALPDVRVGVGQRADQLRQHRRVGGVELLAYARQVDARGQPLEQDVGVADAGG